MLRDLDFSYAQGGTILFGAYFGFLIATLTTGLLADTFGNKMVLIMAGVCLTVGVIAFSNIRVFGGLVMAMGVIGLGMGAIEVGGNALIVDLHREQSGRYLNLLAAFHGIGSLLVPIYAAQLLQNGFSWQQTFLYSLPGVILFLLWFSVAPYPHTRTETTQGFSWQQVRQTGFSPSMRWFYLLLSFYVATELGVAAWLVEFLQQVRGLSVGWSSLFLSLFFGAIMVGRLVGSMVVERVGYLKSMLVAMLAAMICLALGIFGPERLIILVPLSGLFFSIIFPTTTAAVAGYHRENTGAMLGLLFSFGGLGGAFGPWAIGLAGDWLGIQLGFGLPILYCGIAILALLALRQMER